MIQRIQSLWLLLSTAALGIMYFMPLAHLNINNTEYTIKATGIYSILTNDVSIPTYSIAGLIVISAFLSFIAVFMYKKRILQMRFCVYAAILQIAVLGLLAYYLFYVFSDFKFIPEFTLFLPLVCFIFLLMARRGIKRDEELIRAIDRIR